MDKLETSTQSDFRTITLTALTMNMESWSEHPLLTLGAILPTSVAYELIARLGVKPLSYHRQNLLTESLPRAGRSGFATSSRLKL